MTTRSLSRAALVFLLIAVCVPDSLRGQMGTPTPDGAPLALQPAPLFGDPVGPAMQQPGEKSTWLAGLLSFFLPYGTGSFYAGNSTHGVRHLVIGGTALVGTVVGLAIACDDGFNYCDEDNAGWYVAGGFAIVWLGNWVRCGQQPTAHSRHRPSAYNSYRSHSERVGLEYVRAPSVPAAFGAFRCPAPRRALRFRAAKLNKPASDLPLPLSDSRTLLLKYTYTFSWRSRSEGRA
jgi:hypothetical protein